MQRKWNTVGGVAILVGLLACSSAAAAEIAAQAEAVGGRTEITVSAKFIEAPVGTFPHAPHKPGEAAIISNNALTEVLQSLGGRGNVDLLSAPRLTTLSGQEGVIEIGRELQLPPGKGAASQFLGLKLVLKPTVADDKVELQARASMSYLKNDPVPAGEEPEIMEEESTANLRLGRGDAVMLVPMPGSKQGRETVVFLEVVLLPAVATANAPVTSAQARAASIIVPRIVFREANLRESIGFLAYKSRALDPAKQGVNFVSVPSAGEEPHITLDLTNATILDAARSVAQLAGLRLTADEYALVLARSESSHPAPAENSAALVQAEAMTLPELKFSEATVTEAVEFIRMKSRELDPTKTGVNIILKDEQPDIRISLNLNELPLSEALRYVARLAGLEVRADPNALVLAAPDPAETPAK